MRSYRTQIILLIFFMPVFLSGMYCYGQDVYFVNGKVFADDDKTNDITISLIENSVTTYLPVTSTSSFSAKLKWNSKYHFKFMKSGYVTKIIEFSTFIPNGHTHRIEPYSLNVKLFPVFDGVDKVFFKKPVAKVYFDKKINDFTDDRDYALQVVYAIEQMKKHTDVKSTTPKYSASIKSESTEIKKKNNDVSVSNSADTLKLLEVEVKEKVNNKCLLPPVKKEYKEEKTVEEFNFVDKHITRVIIKEHNKYCVFFRVKHNWGGVYYFIDESPLGVFSVTESLFERKTNIFEPKHVNK